MIKRSEIGQMPSEIRDERECSVQEAQNIFAVSRLLHDLDGAWDIGDLKRVLRQFITMQTGIE